MFKIKNLVLHLVLLKLGVMFNFVLGFFGKNSIVTTILMKKSFKFDLEQELYMTPMFIVRQIENHLPIKEISDK